ncbi:MAG: cytoplasmic protein, partial [candidate division KSB1 bacterium]|nr:cytoplasmic protein [candidate division KSB1 bacterium]
MAEISRREFLAKFATGVALSCTIPPGLRLLRGQVNSLTPELVVVQGPSPRENVRHALNLLGGIGAFVRRGDVVVVKPNMSWDRLPEQAANTNPEVVAEIVR